jgi:purine-nucleoside phosphorylase
MLLFAAAAEELGDLEGHVVGIGPVVAASRAATLIERTQPDHIVMIGSGGAYPGGPAIGTPIAARRVGWSYGVAAMGLGYVPRAPAPVECDAPMLERLGLEVAAVLTTGAVTTDLTLAGRLSDGWQVEHLEAFGVALACQQAGVRFTLVLGIANLVGPDAHVEWLTNRDAAQDAARDAVRSLFQA